VLLVTAVCKTGPEPTWRVICQLARPSSSVFSFPLPLASLKTIPWIRAMRVSPKSGP